MISPKSWRSLQFQRKLEWGLASSGSGRHQVEKLTKKWLLKQSREEKNKVWSKQAEITPGGKSFHRAEKQQRIECPHCRSKFVIGKFFAHREICSNLTSTERNRQNNSRICRRAKLASNLQMNQREDIPAAQPCPGVATRTTTSRTT